MLQGNDTPVAPAVARVFAFLIQAERSIAVDQAPAAAIHMGSGAFGSEGDRGRYILSTAHKSKGSEWDLVHLAQDFDRHIMSCQLSKRWH